MKCPQCAEGIRVIRGVNSYGESQRIEVDCENCNGTGQIPDPNAPEEQTKQLERIATALEDIAKTLTAIYTYGAGK